MVYPDAVEISPDRHLSMEYLDTLLSFGYPDTHLGDIQPRQSKTIYPQPYCGLVYSVATNRAQLCIENSLEIVEIAK